MKQEFYNIYEDLSSRFEAGITEFPYLFLPPWPFGVEDRVLARSAARSISEGIDAAIDVLENQTKLRPDAKYFLLTNFFEMVVLPLCHRDNPTPPTQDELQSAIFQDMRTILVTAGEQHRGEEIGGGEILRVTAELLDGLSISAFRFWGARDNDDLVLEAREDDEQRR